MNGPVSCRKLLQRAGDRCKPGEALPLKISRESSCEIRVESRHGRSPR